MSEESFRMSSHRPYLLRALVEWINDNGMTPHIMVDAGVPGVQVPASAIKEVMRLHIDNETVSFTARFSGVSFPVSVPISAVLAVYARETGQGMALPDDIPGADLPPDDDDTPPPAPEPPPVGKRPFLRVVK
jgi:stringent starvation protein B